MHLARWPHATGDSRVPQQARGEVDVRAIHAAEAPIPYAAKHESTAQRVQLSGRFTHQAQLPPLVDVESVVIKQTQLGKNVFCGNHSSR